LIERLGAQGKPPQPAEKEPLVVKDDLWAILEDLPELDHAMVLVDFDEEPDVFDEDPGDYHEDDGQIPNTVASSPAPAASPRCQPSPLTSRTVNAEWWERMVGGSRGTTGPEM
jgi:hypothetical protein